MSCIECQSPTKNPKFCSRSCAAKYNNRKFPKRSPEPQNKCSVCDKYTRSHKRTFNGSTLCQQCYRKTKVDLYQSMTLQESIDKSMEYAAKHKFQHVRAAAHRFCKLHNITTKTCQKCGYDKHAELCHKKSIASFDPSTPLSEINSTENIVFLCPNCHWELDNS